MKRHISMKGKNNTEKTLKLINGGKYLIGRLFGRRTSKKGNRIAAQRVIRSVIISLPCIY